MATRADQIPTEQNQDQNLDQELEQQSNVEDSSSPQTQETPQSLTDHESLQRYIGVLESTLQENNRTIQQLANRTTEPQQPTESVEERNKRFFVEPTAIVREEVAQAVAPLNAFVQQFQRKTEYDRLKSKFQVNPMYAGHLSDSRVSAFVDQVFDSGKVEVNDATMQQAIIMGVGQAAMGALGAAPTTTQQQEQQVRVDPPTQRPSAPNAPRQVTKPAVRALTENEKTIARMKGMTDEQYLAWLNVPASAVASSQIGKVAK